MSFLYDAAAPLQPGQKSPSSSTRSKRARHHVAVEVDGALQTISRSFAHFATLVTPLYTSCSHVPCTSPDCFFRLKITKVLGKNESEFNG